MAHLGHIFLIFYKFRSPITYHNYKQKSIAKKQKFPPLLLHSGKLDLRAREQKSIS